VRTSCHFLLVLSLLLTIGTACAEPHQAEARILLQSSPIAGYRYHEGKAVWNELQVDAPLDLVREADNPYDALAVRVDWHGHVLGYVPRADNRAVARLLDRGETVEARIVKLRKSRNPRERVQFEVYVPVSGQAEHQAK
jgi:hypothetical protein